MSQLFDRYLGVGVSWDQLLVCKRCGARVTRGGFVEIMNLETHMVDKRGACKLLGERNPVVRCHVEGCDGCLLPS